MTSKGRPPGRAGGFLIAISTLIGAVVGIALRQPSIGVLAGTGFGAGLALLIWWRDRPR